MICEACNGIGFVPHVIPEKIVEGHDRFGHYYRRIPSRVVGRQCWSCNGNGLDPAAFFTWSKEGVVKPPQPSTRSTACS